MPLAPAPFSRRLCLRPVRVLAALSVLLVGLVNWAEAHANPDAGAFLVTFGQNAAKELNDPDLSVDDREKRFRELFNEAVDIPAIGRFILGPYWRRAKEPERAGFLKAFEDIALQRFLPMFTRKSDEFRGKSFDVVDLRPVGKRPDQVFVYTRVERPSGPPVDMIWRVRKHGGKYRILDISVQGLSMALTLRDEYRAVAKRLGGVGPLIQVMRKKLSEGAYAPKTLGAVEPAPRAE